jgi:hypothetical protein
MWKRAHIFILQLLTHTHKEHSTHVFPLSFLSPSPSCARSENPNKQVNDLHQPSPHRVHFRVAELVDTKNQFGLKDASAAGGCLRPKGIWTIQWRQTLFSRNSKRDHHAHRRYKLHMERLSFLFSLVQNHIRCKFPHASLVVFSRKGCAQFGEMLSGFFCFLYWRVLFQSS